MQVEDREEFVDMVAQAVIDKLDERDRINGLVNLVVQRIIELQSEEARALADDEDELEEAIEQGKNQNGNKEPEHV
jgi:hypothetical protein